MADYLHPDSIENKLGLGRVPPESQEGMIWRGMSGGEYKNLLEQGFLESKGEYNIGESQKGLTIFSSDPRTAEMYAHDFAPRDFKALPESSAYVVGIRKPSSAVPQTYGAASEFGVRGRIPIKDIVSVYRGNVFRPKSDKHRAVLDWQEVPVSDLREPRTTPPDQPNLPVDITNPGFKLHESAALVRYADSPDTIRAIVSNDDEFALENLRELKADETSAEATTQAELVAVRRQIYEATQQALSENPDVLTVYRIGRLRGDEPLSFTLDPNFSGALNLPWAKRLEDPSLQAYTVNKVDILAAPNAVLRPGKGTEGELEVLIAGNKVSPKEPRFPDQPNLPEVISSSPEEPDGRPKSKGHMLRGIGSLMRSRVFPLIQLAQMGYDLLPEDKKFVGDFIDYLKETKTHELFGMDKSGLGYFRDLFGMEQPEPEPSQRISSKDTSIKQIAAVFKKPEIFDLKEGSVNLDIGGGRFDLGTDYLRNERGVENLVFDKFNRSPEHNEEVLNRIREIGGTDSATAANILNVIEEPEARKSVIQQSYDYTKEGGKVLFQIYEGSGTGVGRETTKGWQNNRKTSEYIPEIEGIFGKGGVQRKGNIIIAIKERRPQKKAAGGFVDKPLYDDARVGGLV